MPSNLHQLELSFNPLEDRLVLKIYTTDLSEFRFWLTRRFTKMLWELLSKLLASEQSTQIEHKQRAEKVTKAFEDEQSKKRPLADKLSTKISKTPLGKDPLLISKLSVKPKDKGLYTLALATEDGKNIEIVVNNYILLSLCKLIAETVKKADWNLDIQYDGSGDDVKKG